VRASSHRVSTNACLGLYGNNPLDVKFFRSHQGHAKEAAATQFIEVDSVAKVLRGRNAKWVMASPRYLSYGQRAVNGPGWANPVVKINFNCPADPAFGGQTFVAGPPEIVPALT
jgi:hypothetical protein